MSMGMGFALASGILFGIGLILGEVTSPATIQGFLDVSGTWDYRLAVTLAGALAVAVVPFAMAKRRRFAWSGEPMRLPASGSIDTRLVVGMTIFGTGWALCGLCPAPALVALGSGRFDALIFVPALAAGMIAHDLRFKA
jgi:uncharacterized membrane protein YedE/YeeE